MKIANVSVQVMGSAWRNLTFLKLTTDEGLTGVSEVRLSNRTNALLGYLEECKKRYVLGSDPFRIEDLVQRMFRHDYGRVGEVVASAISLVEAVRAAVGPDVELLIEMHGRFSPATAVRIARDLEPFEPSWVEEPVPPDNLKALAKAARHIRIPVATGERLHHKHEFRELFERQACDIIQPDITECCGLLEAKKIAAMADTVYITVAPHNVGGQVSTDTARQL